MITVPKSPARHHTQNRPSQGPGLAKARPRRATNQRDRRCEQAALAAVLCGLGSKIIA